MLQVLFRMPMTVAGVPLWIVVLALGVGLGGLMWWLSRRVTNPALAEFLSPVGKGAMVVGVMAAAGAYYFRDSFPKGVPIYGFGMMLFLAFLVCTWLAGRRGEREGIKNETVQDLAIWIFGGGLLGARVSYLLLNEDPRPTLSEFFAKLPRIWDGGIILYGSVVGAIVSYAIA